MFGVALSEQDLNIYALFISILFRFISCLIWSILCFFVCRHVLQAVRALIQIVTDDSLVSFI